MGMGSISFCHDGLDFEIDDTLTLLEITDIQTDGCSPLRGNGFKALCRQLTQIMPLRPIRMVRS